MIDAEDDRSFFQIEPTGHSENGSARRKVEAIYYTYDLGVPKAYYSPEPITLSGNVCIAGVSVFSLQSITVTNEGGGTGCEGEGGGHITGTDTAYGNWQNDYNSTSRPDGTTDAGFAAVDGVDVGEEDELGRRDFDNSTDPQFVAEPEEADPAVLRLPSHSITKVRKDRLTRIAWRS